MSSFANDSRTWTEPQMREWLGRQTGAHIREIAASLGLPTTRRPGRMPLAALIDSIVAERTPALAAAQTRATRYADSVGFGPMFDRLDRMARA